MPFVTQDQDSKADPPSYEKPVPRPPKSELKSREIRAQNRRREYLERNPDYLKSTEHEFADPLLYDSLIRTHQTPAEREADGKRKGYSRVLEGDLVRGEARLADLAQKAAQSPSDEQSPPSTASARKSNLAAVDLELSAPQTKEEALTKWHEFLVDRFVHGHDEDFDYDAVDFDDSYDVMARREAQDAWFEEEDPSWASELDDAKSEAHREKRAGETGVQDF